MSPIQPASESSYPWRITRLIIEIALSLTRDLEGRQVMREIWSLQLVNRSLSRRTSKTKLGLLDLPNELVLLILEAAAVSAPGTLHATLRVNRVLRFLTLYTLKDAMDPLSFKHFKTPTDEALDCFSVYRWMPNEFQSMNHYQYFNAKLINLRRRWRRPHGEGSASKRTIVDICVHLPSVEMLVHFGCCCLNTTLLVAEDAMDWGPVIMRVLFLMWERDRRAVTIVHERKTLWESSVSDLMTPPF
ncbi:hypothetical protein P171DRAFT_484630 [Karstenula rhodostoma CBS 690.94]|uniref:Uncharacterized protein n=1 Tax=Karstenula rhodostoma CBS 690.94 TaxID=1392251 RepID=A0A9P4PJ11_9PLEO|nr:hypothetical protein P171DRAFT_484630 [Karstenula rhodostoma CBS 690.94]